MKSFFAVSVCFVLLLGIIATASVEAKGGSYRSANTGRFVSPSYGRSNKGTTIRHGKY